MVDFTALRLVVLISALGYCSSTEYPTVKIKQGVLRGTYGKSYDGRVFSAFEGIPYAKPPIGELRFAEPIAASGWIGTLVANKTYTCPQISDTASVAGTEDCLYLYVYVPGNEVKKDAKLPVIVHIHGGAFMVGSPEGIARPEYIIDQDVIYVTMNYRLGILGFLSTEDGIVPGNMGLKDQSLALQWIRDNINDFGGNPESITLTGLSAGGSSVHYHYLSPLSKGLFDRGFSMSGTALLPWALTENPLEKAKFVARNIGCETDCTKKMVACLRSKSHEDLLIGMGGLYVLNRALPCTPFGPVIEKAGYNKFIDEHPYKLLKDGKVHDVPWINTNVKDEGIFPVGFYFHPQTLEYIADNWDTVMPAALDMNDTVDESHKKEVVQQIKKFYFEDQPVTSDNIDTLVKVYSDRFFLLDSILATRTHAKAVKSPVYYYFYNFVQETNFNFPHIKPGVGHGLDGSLIFKWTMMLTQDLKENEAKMMKILTKFMKKFASTGVPEVAGVKWEPLDSGEDIRYLEINSPNDIKMKTMKELETKEFWDTLPIKENNHIYGGVEQLRQEL